MGSDLHELELSALDGSPGVLADRAGEVLLIVNVASKCGLTPQYEQLQRLQDTYGERGFSVLGVPCNQFLEQEPGSADEIAGFCSATYGVTFPLAEKIEVNGDGRHQLYERLTDTADSTDGHIGDVRWNFEKFLVGRDGTVLARFSPVVSPEDPAVIGAIEAALD
jgi:glutathione peroxidase